MVPGRVAGVVAIPVPVHPALVIGQIGVAPPQSLASRIGPAQSGIRERVGTEVPAIDPAKLTESRVPISEAEGVVEASPRSMLGVEGTGHSADVADRLARSDLLGCKAGARIKTGPNTRLR